MSDDELTGIGKFLATLVQEMMVIDSVRSILLQSRETALLEEIRTMRPPGDANPPTLEALRSSVDSRTRALADKEIAKLADEDMHRASILRRVLDQFYPPEDQ